MTQKVILRNEVVKVKGRIKAITIPKEDFSKFLKLTKLRILNKEYETLMPPIDDMKKNTIDVNGLAQLLQNYFSIFITGTGNQNVVPPAQMILTTSSGNTITLSYSKSISLGSQGVTVFIQIYESSGNYNFQYYYVGFDTSNNSYDVSQAELYVSVQVQGIYTGSSNYYTPLIRIAYSNISLSKSSSEYLFLVWLIEFESIPPYLIVFTPVFQNNLGIFITGLNGPEVPSTVIIYFNNNNCQFVCGGNCPASGLNGFVTYIQNNTVIVEFPLQASLRTSVTQLQVLLCTTANLLGLTEINCGSYCNYSTTLTSSVSGASFYIAIATMQITYQVS